jgi:hypothetical protein
VALAVRVAVATVELPSEELAARDEAGLGCIVVDCDVVPPAVEFGLTADEGEGLSRTDPLFGLADTLAGTTEYDGSGLALLLPGAAEREAFGLYVGYGLAL